MDQFRKNPPYDARSVANYVLSEFCTSDMTNLKINKLLFFVHGWSLIRLDYPIIANRIEAWDNGPVIRVVYDSFKCFGAHRITSKATYFDHRTQTEIEAPVKIISPKDREFISRIVSSYIDFTASELKELTHRPGTPWTQVRSSPVRGIRNRISDELIVNYFASEFGGPLSH